MAVMHPERPNISANLKSMPVKNKCETAGKNQYPSDYRSQQATGVEKIDRNKAIVRNVAADLFVVAAMSAAAMSAAARTAVSTTAAAAAATLDLIFSLVDPDRPAIQLGAVHFAHGVNCAFVAGEGDKPEATRTAGFPIGNDFGFDDLAEPLKCLVQPVVGRTPTQPANKQFLTHRKKHSKTGTDTALRAKKQKHTGLGGSQAHAPRRQPQWPPMVNCSLPPFMVLATCGLWEYRLAY
jgi:hypothetical protein